MATQGITHTFLAILVTFVLAGCVTSQPPDSPPDAMAITEYVVEDTTYFLQEEFTIDTANGAALSIISPGGVLPRVLAIIEGTVRADVSDALFVGVADGQGIRAAGRLFAEPAGRDDAPFKMLVPFPVGPANTTLIVAWANLGAPAIVRLATPNGIEVTPLSAGAYLGGFDSAEFDAGVPILRSGALTRPASAPVFVWLDVAVDRLAEGEVLLVGNEDQAQLTLDGRSVVPEVHRLAAIWPSADVTLRYNVTVPGDEFEIRGGAWLLPELPPLTGPLDASVCGICG
jgi:hypothetical protein